MPGASRSLVLNDGLAAPAWLLSMRRASGAGMLIALALFN
ncbi:hypothetical protein SynNOUM97013_01783 [Synechococcus sp. NOUM97013]|nr:hypothetical protein SynNOUM97013_01783 [Synechococcus sp. NOUM97013]